MLHPTDTIISKDDKEKQVSTQILATNVDKLEDDIIDVIVDTDWSGIGGVLLNVTPLYLDGRSECIR